MRRVTAVVLIVLVALLTVAASPAATQGKAKDYPVMSSSFSSNRAARTSLPRW